MRSRPRRPSSWSPIWRPGGKGWASFPARGHRLRAVLRRGRRDAAGGPRPVRRPGQQGPGAGPPEAVLRHVRLRAPSRGQRRRHRPVTRPPAQLSARERPSLSPIRNGAGGTFPGRAGLTHVRLPVAVEPQPSLWPSCASEAVGRTRCPFSGWRPTISWPRCFLPSRPVRRTRRGAPCRYPTTSSCTRPSTTACTRPWTLTPWWAGAVHGTRCGPTPLRGLHRAVSLRS